MPKVTIRTADNLEAICNGLKSGKSLRRTCSEMGLNEGSVRTWFYDDAEAASHSARARELGHDALADECIDIADDRTLDPAEKRVRVDTRLRLLGKWSQRYSDKVTNAHAGADGVGPIQSVVRVERVIVDPANSDAA